MENCKQTNQKMESKVNNTILTTSDIIYLKSLMKDLYYGGCSINEDNLGKSMSLPVDIFYKLVSNLKDEYKIEKQLYPHQ